MITQKTHSKAGTFCEMFQFQEGIFNNALDNLSEEAALKRISKTSNHMNWLLGHIVHCRFMLAGMIGLQETNPNGKIYWAGIEDMQYPSILEVTSQMKIISEKLIDKLAQLSDNDLDFGLAPDQPPLKDTVPFFLYHEAYHLGQIGMVRKLLGPGTLKSH